MTNIPTENIKIHDNKKFFILSLCIIT